MSILQGVKGIIFDYGGTIDSNGDHWSEVLWEAYKQVQVPVEKSRFRDAYVFGERSLATHPYIRPEHNFYNVLEIKAKLQMQYLIENGCLESKEKAEFFAVSIAGICYEFARGTVLKAKDLIALLYEKYPMVMVSNFYGNIQTVLSDFGLDSYFKTIIESAVVKIRKPDPAIFDLGVKALSLCPQETVVIGDSYKKDILPAQSLGCQTVWIKGKGWTDDETALEHKHIVYNFVDLKDLLL